MPTIERTVLHKDPGKGPNGSDVYKLLAEGTGLLSVMGVSGVVGVECETNHIMEMEQVLGIEVARNKIISEIEGVMGAFGMDIDHRHSMLLADCMTYKVLKFLQAVQRQTAQGSSPINSLLQDKIRNNSMLEIN